MAWQEMLRRFGLERLPEIYFGVIGERLAAKLLFNKAGPEKISEEGAEEEGRNSDFSPAIV
jgi:hypothetical protein